MRYRRHAFTLLFLTVAAFANAQNCFLTSTGATCCPNTFLCATDPLCAGHQACLTGSTTCTVVQCARAGEPPPIVEPPVVEEENEPTQNEANPGSAPENSGDETVANSLGLGDDETQQSATQNQPEIDTTPPGTQEQQNQATQNNQNNVPPTPTAAATAPSSNPPSVLEPWADLLSCRRNEQRRRREVSDLSDSEWQRFVNALEVLKNNRTSRRNPEISAYDDLAILHTDFVEEAHGGSFFLPWHRLFLFLLESLLREIDPRVTLPYWNWSLDNPQNAALSSVWNRFGHSWATQDAPQCITHGPWADWWSIHQTPHCVSRGFTTGPQGTFPPLEPWNNIRNLYRADIDYSSFATTVEAIHGSVHVGVGGDMTILGTAPNDPVFHLHHCFVDHIWYRWQRNGNGNWGRYGGTHPTLNGAESTRDDEMTAFSKTVRAAQGLNCVRYIDSAEMIAEPTPPPAPPRPINAMPAPAPVQGRTANRRDGTGTEDSPAHTILFSTEAGPKTGNSFALPSEEQAKIADEVLSSLDAEVSPQPE